MAVYTKLHSEQDPLAKPGAGGATRQGRSAPAKPSPSDANPSLVFAKQHPYDDFEEFDTKRSRYEYLGSVAKRVNTLFPFAYRDWHDAFLKSCESLSHVHGHSFTTAWRLTIGWSTNPALENGFSLHPIWAFPLLPGSQVRGLMKAVAEMELLEGPTVVPQPPEELPSEPPAALLAALDGPAAWRLRAIFGSLSLTDSAEGAPETAFGRFSRWLKLIPKVEIRPVWLDARRRLAELCEEHTGGLVACLDAVPAPEQRNVLSVDVLTTHHKDYYTSLYENRMEPPADTEDPVPIHFLAVPPGVEFEFRFRLRMPVKDDDEISEHCSSALGGWEDTDVLRQLEHWLARGLEELGLGAKTSAGYGYFQRGRADTSTRPGATRSQTAAGRPAATRGAPTRPAAGRVAPAPRVAPPQRPTPPPRPAASPEARIRELLPEGFDERQLAAKIDEVFRSEETDDIKSGFAARVKALFSATLSRWSQSPDTTKRRRVERLEAAIRRP